jgi:uncharacterized damage-inducible protein DinB
MGKAHLERMLKYMTWADQKILVALRDHPEVQGEALPLFAHMLAAEHVWLSRLEQREPRVPVWPQLTISECEQFATENAQGYAAFVSRLLEDQLTTLVRYRNTKGQEFATAVIDILTQLVIHGGYHRGQIAKVFGRNGIQAVSTDFIIYVREAESA